MTRKRANMMQRSRAYMLHGALDKRLHDVNKNLDTAVKNRAHLPIGDECIWCSEE